MWEFIGYFLKFENFLFKSWLDELVEGYKMYVFFIVFRGFIDDLLIDRIE